MNYYDVANKFEVLPKEEQLSLAIQCKAGDKQAREKLIKHNLRLVLFLARKYSKKFPWIDINELISVGNIGLLQAVNAYNPNGISFGSYAFIYIKGSIIHYINISNHNGLTFQIGGKDRSGRNVDRKLMRFGKEVNHILEEKDTESKEELIKKLAEISKVSIDVIKKHLTHKQIYTYSIDNTISEDNTYHDIVGDNKAVNQENYLCSKDNIEKMLVKLDAKEKELIINKFINGSLESEIAKDLGISKERVRQIKMRGLYKLKAHLEGRNLKVKYTKIIKKNIRITKITEEQAREIKKLSKKGMTNRKLALMFGVGSGTIWRTINIKKKVSYIKESMVIY